MCFQYFNYQDYDKDLEAALLQAEQDLADITRGGLNTLFGASSPYKAKAPVRGTYLRIL